MPTNRKRQMRQPQRLSMKLSPAERDELIMKDFLGMLTPGEIEVAKANGLHRWNLWVQANALVRGRLKDFITSDKLRQGVRVAPVFASDGRPRRAAKYVINDYDELGKYQISAEKH